MSGVSRGRAIGVALVLFILIVLAAPLCIGVPRADAATARPSVHPPLDFEINQGQTDPRVAFLSRGSGYTLFLTADGAVMRLAPPRPGRHNAAPAGRAAVVMMTWLGASPRPVIEGLDPLEAKSHYFIGNDPARWRTNVARYASVRYRGLYPGIDLVYYGDMKEDAQRLEYDLVVEPGADPRAIRLAVEGVDSAAVDARGDLLLTAAGGVITQRRPVIYQEIDGVRRPVAGSYVVRSSVTGRREIGFTVALYDVSRPLIIDPVLALSTYWGGAGTDEATAVAVNINDGDIYLAGYTDSGNFPIVNTVTAARVTGGGTYAFLTQLNAKGTAVICSTFIGGSDQDPTPDPAPKVPSVTQALGLAVDGGGAAYLTGWTNAVDFPVFPNDPATNKFAFQIKYGGSGDAFVVKIARNGTALNYATYLGGTGFDQGNSIKVTGTLAYVAGTTESGDFPTQVPWQAANGGGPQLGKDAFLAKLNDKGTALTFSTYFGGAGTDEGLALAVGTDGTSFLTGSTNSNPFPIVPAATAFQAGYGGGNSDAFVARFSADGRTLLYSTYLGGDGDDVGRAVTVDNGERAFVTGETTSPQTSTKFPVTTDAFQADNQGGQDLFITEVDALGKTLVYSTYFGGSLDDVGYGIAESPEDFIYLTGKTFSTNFPMLNPVQPSLNGAGTSDAFVARLAPDWQLDYSTFWGGGGDDVGRAIVVDVGVAHVAGDTTSHTAVGDLQTLNPVMLTNPAYDGSMNGGGVDAFLLSLQDDRPNGCNMGPFHSFGRVDPGLPILMGAAAGLWWLRRLRRTRGL
jgi:hypothetical protein